MPTRSSSPYRDEEYEAGAKYQITPKFPDHRRRLPHDPTARDDQCRHRHVLRWSAHSATGAGSCSARARSPRRSACSAASPISTRGWSERTSRPPMTSCVVGVPHFKSDMTADYHPAYRGRLRPDRHAALRERPCGDQHQQQLCAVLRDGRSGRALQRRLVRPSRDAAAERHQCRRQAIFRIDCGRQYRRQPGANTAYSGAPRTVMASLEFDL